MTVVYKYELTEGIQKIKMPLNSKVLFAGGQNDKPVVWAEVAPAFNEIERVFMVVQTGEKMYESDGYNRNYVGTCLLDKGKYVLHIYELVPIEPY